MGASPSGLVTFLLTDVEGSNLEPTKCLFPDIKREMEVYNHVDAFLLMERIRMQ